MKSLVKLFSPINKQKIPWWVEISTTIPRCTYFFGPFDSVKEAKQEQTGYIDDLVQEKALAEYFEKAAAVCKNPKLTSNWVMSDVLRELKGSDHDVEDIPLPAEDLGELLLLIEMILYA